MLKNKQKQVCSWALLNYDHIQKLATPLIKGSAAESEEKLDNIAGLKYTSNHES